MVDGIDEAVSQRRRPALLAVTVLQAQESSPVNLEILAPLPPLGADGELP